jgi:hypothetical protein
VEKLDQLARLNWDQEKVTVEERSLEEDEFLPQNPKRD